MDHRAQIIQELRQQYDALTKRIEALDLDIGRSLDAELSLVLKDRRSQAAADRDRLARELENIPALPVDLQARETGGRPKKRTMEYDELTRLIYEVRSDVAVIANKLNILEAQVRERCGGETSTIPPQFLLMLAIGGVITILMLAFLTVRIGFAG